MYKIDMNNVISKLCLVEQLRKKRAKEREQIEKITKNTDIFLRNLENEMLESPCGTTEWKLVCNIEQTPLDTDLLERQFKIDGYKFSFHYVDSKIIKIKIAIPESKLEEMGAIPESKLEEMGAIPESKLEEMGHKVRI